MLYINRRYICSIPKIVIMFRCYSIIVYISIIVYKYLQILYSICYCICYCILDNLMMIFSNILVM